MELQGAVAQDDSDDDLEEDGEELRRVFGKELKLRRVYEGYELHLSYKNKTGYKGVHPKYPRGNPKAEPRYQALYYNETNITLGVYKTILEAALAYAKYVASMGGPSGSSTWDDPNDEAGGDAEPAARPDESQLQQPAKAATAAIKAASAVIKTASAATSGLHDGQRVKAQYMMTDPALRPAAEKAFG